jgi:hypothetical protein
MNKKRLITLMVVSIVLFVMSACQGSKQTSPTATSVPKTVQPQATQTSQPSQTSQTSQTGLYIVGYSNYTDSFGDFHIVGELKNGGTKVLTQMELTVEVKDVSGNSLLTDSNNKNVASLTFSPSLDNLAPGESSPFEFSVSSDAGKPDKYTVSVTGFNTSTVQRPKIEVKNTQMVSSEYGSFYISGEIINLDTKPVLIHNLAGAMIDSKGQVVSTSYSSDYSSYLEPAGNSDELDRTPFFITVDDPGSSPGKWNTYLDAEAVDPIDEYAISVKIANNYQDENKTAHVVGTVTNNSSVVLSTLVVAGLYAADGTVLDAYSSRTPVHVDPGETVPFDITAFSNVNNNAAQASRIDHITVQIDSDSTFETSIESVLMETTNDNANKNGSNWTVTGQVKNSAQKSLSSETVVVMVYDASGALIAVNWDDLFPTGDSYANGDVASYTVDIYFDPNVDTSGYTFKTLVKGDVK